MKTLVVFFSAEGTTAKVAKKLAEIKGAESVEAKLVHSAEEV